MKKMLFLIFATAVILFQRYTYHKFNGFSVYSVEAPIPMAAPLIDLNPQMQALLQQPFHFLALGKQAFVFESADGQHVLKLIKTKRFNIRSIERWYYNWVGSAQADKVDRRIDQELKSYQLAYHELKNASQILGVKLGPSTTLGLLTIKDPWGLTKKIDLNKASFIIQPKAQTFRQIIETSSPSEKKVALEKIKRLIDGRYAKNILDKDPRIHRNIGFIEGEPFFLDLGSFVYAPELSEETKAADLKKILDYQESFMKRVHLEF